MLDFDFKTERNEDTVLISLNNWITNDSNKIQRYRLSGRDVPTYITKALDIYDPKSLLQGKVQPEDIILLTRVVSDVAQCRGFIGPNGAGKYFPVTLMQIIGTFKDGKISLENLNILFNKIIYKKVKKEQDGILEYFEGINNIGKVIKVAEGNQSTKVKVGNYVLVKDNVSTEIMIDGETYYAIEEDSIIGVSNNPITSLDELEFINNIILMTPYIPQKMSKNSLLWTPIINYEDLDYSEIYCRNQFQVNYVDHNLTRVKKDDIIIIDRNVTTYVYFNNQKYFVTNGMNYVEGRRVQ